MVSSDVQCHNNIVWRQERATETQAVCLVSHTAGRLLSLPNVVRSELENNMKSVGAEHLQPLSAALLNVTDSYT